MGDSESVGLALRIVEESFPYCPEGPIPALTGEVLDAVVEILSRSVVFKHRCPNLSEDEIRKRLSTQPIPQPLARGAYPLTESSLVSCYAEELPTLEDRILSEFVF